MTISTTSNKTILAGDGVTTVWPFNFIISDAAFLSVIYTDANNVDTVLAPAQYTAAGIGNPNGGTVTYPLSGSPIAVGTKLTILRTVPYKQTTALGNQTGYYPAVVEGALDYEMEAIQQLSELNDRCLKLPVTVNTLTVSAQIPAPVAGALLGWNTQGTAIVNTVQSGTIPLPLSVANGGTGTTTSTGTGSVVLNTSPSLTTPTIASPSVTGTLTAAGLVDISGAAAGQIKFPATQNASANANTLDDYEEGSVTWVDGSGAGLTIITVNGSYTKIGNRVFVGGEFTYPATVDGTSAQIGGLPFTAGADHQGNIVYSTAATCDRIVVDTSSTQFHLYQAPITMITNAAMTGASSAVDISYRS